MHAIPKVKLNNGLEIPVLGLGTAMRQSDTPEDLYQTINDAINVGYRHFDTAQFYRNEQIVGEVISKNIKEGIVKREDIFICTKLSSQNHRPDLLEASLKDSLKKLQMDYVDLYIIHVPVSLKPFSDDDMDPKDPQNWKPEPGNQKLLDTWKVMEDMVRKGFTKSIGVSNCNSKQLERILKVATIRPVINQVECHPLLNQAKLREFCLARGILLSSYFPLGSQNRPYRKETDPDVLNNPKIIEIALKRGKTPAQILIRWNYQLGNVVLFKTRSKKRLMENKDIFEFELNEEDMKDIESLNCGYRLLTFEWLKDFEEFPFPSDIEF